MDNKTAATEEKEREAVCFPHGQRAVLVLALARVAAARLRADVIVSAQLQALGVDVVGQRFHAGGKARVVRRQLAVARALPVLPAVVDLP